MKKLLALFNFNALIPILGLISRRYNPVQMLDSASVPAIVKGFIVKVVS